jgi:hypothetical protein
MALVEVGVELVSMSTAHYWAEAAAAVVVEEEDQSIFVPKAVLAPLAATVLLE